MGSAAGLSFFRLIVEHGTDVASVHKRDGEFVFVAPTAIRLFGYSDHDLVGESLIALCHESDQLRLQLALRVESGSTEKAAYRVHCGDGHEKWIETIVQSGPSADLVVCMSRDVTEHKKTARALERGLRTLLERAPEAMVVVQDGRVRQCNRVAVQLLGLADDSHLLGKWLKNFLHRDDAAQELEALAGVERDSNNTGLPLHELRFVRGDGSTLDAQSFAVSVAHGDREATLVVFHERSLSLRSIPVVEARTLSARGESDRAGRQTLRMPTANGISKLPTDPPRRRR